MIRIRLVSLTVAITAILGVVVAWQALPVAAQEASLSDEHKARIQTNCVSAKHRLSQLHANDALIRVNRGQLYEAVSVKLMVPMNSRITLNRLDGGDLVDITASYDQDLSAFRASYSAYERQLSDAMKINCSQSPEDFYKAVQTASQSRQQVHTHVVNLHERVRQYQSTFKDFSRDFTQDNTEEEAS